jgi:hypothetical protein
MSGYPIINNERVKEIFIGDSTRHPVKVQQVLTNRAGSLQEVFQACEHRSWNKDAIVYTWAEDHTLCTATVQCSECGALLTETVSSYKDEVEGTCKSYGYYCHHATFTRLKSITQTCGEADLGASTLGDHYWYAWYDKVIEPTCTSDGYTKQTCLYCGETRTKPYSTVAALGHNFSIYTGNDRGIGANMEYEHRCANGCGQTTWLKIKASTSGGMIM